MNTSSAPRRFLHLATIRPGLTGNGLAMRVGMFCEALARLGPTSVIVAAYQDHDPGAPVAGDITIDKALAGDRVDTRLRLTALIPDAHARATALLAGGRPSSTAMLSAPVVAEVATLAGRHRWDAILISRANLLPLLDVLPADVPVFVDLDDDDGLYYREQADLAQGAGDIRRALWLNAEAELHDRLIRASARRVAAFACASEPVAATVRTRLGLGNVTCIPNGMRMPMAARTPEAGDLLFVGNLSYAPNVQGLLWFIAEVWPHVRARLPNQDMTVAGSKPVDRVRAACTAAGIRLVENPADLEPLYRRAGAAVVPLWTGSGTRIKILEAGAYRVPVVSTPKGWEGIELDPTSDIFSAPPEPSAFADACIRCLTDRDEASRRAGRLQPFVRERHDRERIVAAITGQVAGLQSAPPLAD